MKTRIGMLAVAMLAATGVAVAGTPQATLEGSYLEVRSLDVYTAACFANSEVGLTGEEAVLAWNVDRGTHQGVALDGLSVVAVVRAEDSLTDLRQYSVAGKGLIIVDDRATAAQRDALVAFAREEAGELLGRLVRVEPAPIQMSVNETAHGYASLVAGDSLTIETRCLHDSDKKCGNDEAYYPPLTNVQGAMAALTEMDRFEGAGLGVTWNDSGRRNAYLATFAK